MKPTTHVFGNVVFRMKTKIACLSAAAIVIVLPVAADAGIPSRDPLGAAMDEAVVLIRNRQSWAANIPNVQDARRKGGTLMIGIGKPVPEGSTQWRDWWEKAICVAPELKEVLQRDGGVMVYAGSEPDRGRETVWFNRSECYSRVPGWDTKKHDDVEIRSLSAPVGPPYKVDVAGQTPRAADKPHVAQGADALGIRMASVQARLASCDKPTVRAAIEEITRDSSTLREPLMLFAVVSAERLLGRYEEAAFWYLAARLRASRQILFEKGDRPQLLQIMIMVIGPSIMPLLQADPELAARIVKRVQDWDRTTPESFLNRADATDGEMRDKLVKIDEGLQKLPGQLAADIDSMTKARLELANVEKLEAMSYAQRCGPGTLDPVDAEAATKKIKADAERLVLVHPLILKHANGQIKSADTGAYRENKSRLPTRLSVSIHGQSMFAEVDVEAQATGDRKLGPVKLTLACITRLWVGQRDVSWKDVCTGDPNAVKPDPGTADLSQYAALAAEKYPEKQVCAIPGLKMTDGIAVLAAGDYAGRPVGFQIDQSGEEAGQIDVQVNKTDAPVVLMLGGQYPTIWNLSWTEGTRILGVLVSGGNRQVVAGLGKQTPVLISTHDGKGPCDRFIVRPSLLNGVNRLSEKLFGRPIDKAFLAKDGYVVVGEPLPKGGKLLSSPETTPDSFFDKSAPLAGMAGLEVAMAKGLIRKATHADADAWADAEVLNKVGLPESVGLSARRWHYRRIFAKGYVILQPFKYPNGLTGENAAIFIVPKGVQKPDGNPGQSTVYDFNKFQHDKE